MKWHVLQDNNICLKNHVKGSSIPAEFLITDDEIPKNEHEDDEDEKVKLETLSEGLKTLSSKLEGIENKQDEYHKEMLSSFDRIFDILKEQNEQQQKSPYIDVPDWTGPDLECDTKWLGTEVWPVAVNSGCHIGDNFISCVCTLPGSVKCVRRHIAEKKARVKQELGTAFYDWQLDKVGEDVRNSWTEVDEKKFRHAIRLDPPASKRYFWDRISQTFPNKSRASLVSYYFNVYILERIAYRSRYSFFDKSCMIFLS
ncbi:AT-rich interactive domain-containing protein 1-like [Trifolium pratense]|uniref:AT-rich interactive domain-containing protein 1-like n=2 Tax=Trifolium pratense TaxID=57577 RepID=A0A2K3LA94_TRIPR|nr:AT-rich interactive domain-containing protein 1-like [Trifolium pratense]